MHGKCARSDLWVDSVGRPRVGGRYRLFAVCFCQHCRQAQSESIQKRNLSALRAAPPPPRQPARASKVKSKVKRKVFSAHPTTSHACRVERHETAVPTAITALASLQCTRESAAGTPPLLPPPPLCTRQHTTPSSQPPPSRGREHPGQARRAIDTCCFESGWGHRDPRSHPCSRGVAAVGPGASQMHLPGRERDPVWLHGHVAGTNYLEQDD